MMNFLEIYTAWLTVYSLSFTFLPILLVLDWKKRGSAEGFSSINIVLPLLTMACWYKHGVLTNDFVNKFINGFNIIFFTSYVIAFWWYQPKRKYLYCQVATLLVSIFLTFEYVHTHPDDDRADVMGSIAAAGQILSLAGGIYDIKRAISLGTTEYIPATITFGIFGLSVQWSIFALLVNNQYMLVANIAGLALNLSTMVMYLIYPPKTWRVPLFGVGGDEAKKEE